MTKFQTLFAYFSKLQ